MEAAVFYIASAITLLSALMVIIRKNVVQSALFLVISFCSLAVLYILLQAEFIAFIHIMVYAGAIMVLFVFVIMLLNLKDEESLREGFSFQKPVGFIFVIIFIVTLGLMLKSGCSIIGEKKEIITAAVDKGTVYGIAKLMFTDYLFPFEVTSIMLLSAIVGAVVLTKKKR